MSADFDPATGLLTAPRAFLGDLAAHVTGAAAGDVTALDAVLSAAGAGTLEAPHPALAATLEPMRTPIAGITLAKTGFAMPGWLGAGRFTVHVFRSGDGPAPDDQLVPMPADRAPAFVAWLLDVSPRPRGAREAVRVDAQTLNRAVALRLGDRPAHGLLPDPLDEVVAARFRDWWMASAVWPPAEGQPARFAVEALDTDDGLWSIERADDGTALVRPVAPAALFMALCDLVPDSHLVDRSAPRLPAAATPVRGGGLRWVSEVLQGR